MILAEVYYRQTVSARAPGLYHFWRRKDAFLALVSKLVVIPYTCICPDSKWCVRFTGQHNMTRVLPLLRCRVSSEVHTHTRIAPRCAASAARISLNTPRFFPSRACQICRNYFGSAVSSFEVPLDTSALGLDSSEEGEGATAHSPYPAVFIRAPAVLEVCLCRWLYNAKVEKPICQEATVCLLRVRPIRPPCGEGARQESTRHEGSGWPNVRS